MSTQGVHKSRRDWYCGQCGRHTPAGATFVRCGCADHRAVTGVPFCVFCGAPRLHAQPHRCGDHALRDYWITMTMKTRGEL
ncbi:MAG: hypothetical protein H0W02_10260 [Ktedonobacteraceae bacterium]|nr:hypothetical protein [Ktedonobacteraceae bacterium]